MFKTTLILFGFGSQASTEAKLQCFSIQNSLLYGKIFNATQSNSRFARSGHRIEFVVEKI